MAPLIGVGSATVSRWERGIAEPSVTQFALWAAATQQPLDRMIEGLEWCTPSDLNREPTD
ncbi:helix-turn-helix domain-containing protein [Microbacterium oxydans]|uniref:helix-turn-helix domain-containing protein n=1 Tax=Microbacterium oxydans TaxID=82380 RepID=UPI003AFA018C